MASAMDKAMSRPRFFRSISWKITMPAATVTIVLRLVTGQVTARPTRSMAWAIASVAEAWLAIRHGASALGLVSAMPSGPGVISEERIAEIAAVAPPGVATFLLTSQQDPAGIIAQQRRCGTNTIQLVDSLPLDAYAALREALGDRAVVVGMDGFHLANAELLRLGRRERKGAPDTFDVDGYVALWRVAREEAALAPGAPARGRPSEDPTVETPADVST